jgi:pyruvate formate lyase activating enzyme
VENVLSAIGRNRGWIDGIVITGGEPTLHKDLDKFIETFRSLGIKVRLDSNGTNPDVLEDMMMRKLIQCVAMDIKAPLHDEKYEEAAGVPTNVSNIRRSIELIMNSGIEYEFRTTVCPTFMDESDVVEIAKTIKGAQRYVLQGFKPNNCLDSRMLNITPYPEETLSQFAESARAYVENCFVRGEVKKEWCRQW